MDPIKQESLRIRPMLLVCVCALSAGAILGIFTFHHAISITSRASLTKDTKPDGSAEANKDRNANTNTNTNTFCLDEADQIRSSEDDFAILIKSILCPDHACNTRVLQSHGIRLANGVTQQSYLTMVPPGSDDPLIAAFYRDVFEAANITVGMMRTKANMEGSESTPGRMRRFMQSRPRTRTHGIYGPIHLGAHRGLVRMDKTFQYFAVFREPMHRYIAQVGGWSNPEGEKEKDAVGWTDHLSNATQWLQGRVECNAVVASLVGAGLLVDDGLRAEEADGDRRSPAWPMPCKGYDAQHQQLVQRALEAVQTQVSHVFLYHRPVESMAMLCDALSVDDSTCLRLIARFNRGRQHLSHSQSQSQSQSHYALSFDPLLGAVSDDDFALLHDINAFDLLLFDALARDFELRWERFRLLHPRSRLAYLNS